MRRTRKRKSCACAFCAHTRKTKASSDATKSSHREAWVELARFPNWKPTADAKRGRSRRNSSSEPVKGEGWFLLAETTSSTAAFAKARAALAGSARRRSRLAPTGVCRSARAFRALTMSGPTKGGATLKSEYRELTADRYGWKFFAKTWPRRPCHAMYSTPSKAVQRSGSRPVSTQKDKNCPNLDVYEDTVESRREPANREIASSPAGELANASAYTDRMGRAQGASERGRPSRKVLAST